MRRVAVKVAYLGKEFCGSQIQPGKRTVEGEILSSLCKIMNRPKEWFRLKMAGRTDRGVNALKNVAVFNTEFEDIEELMNALNCVSDGIFYLQFALVDEKFEPRHAARRTYRYFLPSDHDIDKMKECAELFVGEHDFKRFCKADERSTTVNIQQMSVSPMNGMIAIDVTADHFLWNMVRRISSAMSEVGKGISTLEDVKAAIDGKDLSFGNARPDALFLMDVEYDNIEFIDIRPSKHISENVFRLAMETEFFSRLMQ